MIGVVLIALSLVIFAVWGILRLRSGGDGDTADTEGEATPTPEESGGDADSPSELERQTPTPATADSERETSDSERTSRNEFSWSEVDTGAAEPSPTGSERTDASTQSDASTPADDIGPTVDERTDDTVERPDEPQVEENGTTTPAEHPLTDARTAFDEEAYEKAVEAAYTTAREALQTRYGIESAQTPAQFFDRCASAPSIDDSVLRPFEQLTDVHDRAVYGYGAATEDEANEALSHATTVLTNSSGT